MHLNVFIAKSGFCSRRKAAFLIKEGRVKLNGNVTKEPWHEVKERDSIEVSGKKLELESGAAYIVFNKPKGVVTTVKDRFANKKIVDFIPKKFGRVYPVGRLDKDSRGLVILTNDGRLCHRLTHPKFEIEKEYELVVKGRITEKAVENLKKGVRDKDDILCVKKIKVEAQKRDKSKIKVVICEGKKRHLRRLFESLGFSVLDLRRIRVGNLMLGNLKEGSFRILDKESIYGLACGHNFP